MENQTIAYNSYPIGAKKVNLYDKMYIYDIIHGLRTALESGPAMAGPAGPHTMPMSY